MLSLCIIIDEAVDDGNFWTSRPVEMKEGGPIALLFSFT